MLDAHQHFWRIDRGDYGWMDGAGPLLRRDYLPADLLPHLHRFGVSKTILIQAAPTRAETEFMLGLARENDFIAGVVGWLDLESGSFAEELSQLRADPKFVGLRPMLQDLEDDSWILRPAVLASLAQMASADIPLDVLSLPRHLPYVLEALNQVPNLRAVINHISKPSIATGALQPWQDHIATIATLPNVYCKISGLITEADHATWASSDLVSYVGHVVECFGADRLMWGSDWPVCRLAGEYSDVLAATMLALPPHLRGDARIFGENAIRFYFGN